jgi:hypothetical protein
MWYENKYGKEKEESIGAHGIYPAFFADRY